MGMGLPDVAPRPAPADLSIEDVREVIRGLEHGWYRTRDLYPRYVAWAEQVGKEPVGRVQLGRVLYQVADGSYISSGVRVFELNDPSRHRA
jgi:hypothetical protein